jgi:aldose 1-epimerase
MSEASASALPSGQQFELRRGATRAVVTEMGAGLRVFSVGGRSFLDTYEQDHMPVDGRGALLLPFPNRIADGKYVFRGEQYQLPINEVGPHHAIHGMTRWMNWRLVEQGEDRLTLALTLHAQPGYPFVLALQATYQLTENGLEMRTTARNIGADLLPYGAGHHPYFTVGSETIDADLLTLPARAYFHTDQRQIPMLPSVSVEGTLYDFRTPRDIGSTVMDTGFTDLARDADGYARVIFAAPAGTPRITLYMDAAYQYLQVFTGDTVQARERRRHGLAIEPYTCAANAYNNGLGLAVLEPGQSFSSVWGFEVAL